MMMTDTWTRIIDSAEDLCSMILSSEPALHYKEAYYAVYSDQLLVEDIRLFQQMKEQYEDVQRFGRYHPDYNKIMKDVRVQKRQLDLNEKVANLKIAENELQDLLDEVSLLVGKTVSDSVMVPVSNPFFSTSSSCSSGGGCGSGGSCSCSA